MKKKKQVKCRVPDICSNPNDTSEMYRTKTGNYSYFPMAMCLLGVQIVEFKQFLSTMCQHFVLLDKKK